MPSIRIISAAQVRELLDPEGLRQALEHALAAQSAGRADVPPRIAARAPDGLSAAMPGYLEGVGLATKLVTIFPGNVEQPSHMGVIVHFDPATGAPLAVMDAEVITEERTAMTAAIAAHRLARSDATVLAVVGAGAQGRAHLRAFSPLRTWREIRITSRTPEHAAQLAAWAHEAIGLGVDVVDRTDSAVRDADVIALCTHADAPVIDAGAVAAGAHVSSVGSQSELPTELTGIGPLVVDHLGAITTPPPSGASELQHVDPHRAVELGALLSGAPGRTDDDQVTVYKSTGHAVQDVAAAALVYDAAVAAGLGTIVEL